jgi:tetratricopeptide (TPR) repeat protein
MRQAHFASFLFVALAGLTPAETRSASEGRQNHCEVWGQVISSGQVNEDGLEVELSGNQMSRQRMQIVGGAFDFHKVPPGTYLFRLFNRSGRLILERAQWLSGSNDGIILRIPYLPPEPSTAPIISLAELSHKIPRPALDAFRAAMKAVEAGDLQTSVDYFQKAAAIDSQYVEAETDLAVLYSGMGRRAEALQHAQRAFEINPRWEETGYTLATLLIATRQYAKAETLARTMLANGQAVPEMHAILAVSLIGQRRSFEEAFGHLRLAAKDFPLARLLAANVLEEIGLNALAAIQANDYMQFAAHECERPMLEQWMASMDQSKTAATVQPQSAP